MPSTINANNTTGLVSTADTSGVLQLQTNGTTAVTVDASQVVTFAKQPAGTFAGTGPAFSAYLSADQTVTTGTLTKVAFNTEVFDTASAYDNATNYRFTPLVSGYYQVNSTVLTLGSTTQSVYINSIYKNGSVYRNGVQTAITFSATGTNGFSVSDLIFMNGTTDYLEIYCRIDGTGTMKFIGTSSYSSFSASMVRGA
jgi:hypothetical protein